MQRDERCAVSTSTQIGSKSSVLRPQICTGFRRPPVQTAGIETGDLLPLDFFDAPPAVKSPAAGAASLSAGVPRS